MFYHNLSRHSTPWVLSSGVAAGSGDTQTSAVLNMSQDQGVMFTVVFGTITSLATGLIKIQQSADNGVADPFADVAGSGVTYSSSNTLQGCLIDIYRPWKTYLQVQVLRRAQANTVIAAIVAHVYHLSVAPELAGNTSTTGNIFNVKWLNNPGPGAP